MNHSYFEGRSKEKVKDFLEEGQRSQAYYRSGARKSRSLPSLSKLILFLLGIMGLLSVLMR
jgi:hypothetical protein